jgi:TonB family protein
MSRAISIAVLTAVATSLGVKLPAQQILHYKVLDSIPPRIHRYTPPREISCPPVVFPDSIRRQGIGGDVLLTVLVDTSGHVPRSEITVRRSPHPGLAAAAIDMASGCRFEPARVDTHPVRQTRAITVTFTIHRR